MKEKVKEIGPPEPAASAPLQFYSSRDLLGLLWGNLRDRVEQCLGGNHVSGDLSLPGSQQPAALKKSTDCLIEVNKH